MNTIGSFNITKKDYFLGVIYTVTYCPEHTKTLYWQFINDEEAAIAFAEKKTIEEKKYYRRKNI